MSDVFLLENSNVNVDSCFAGTVAQWHRTLQQAKQDSKRLKTHHSILKFWFRSYVNEEGPAELLQTTQRQAGFKNDTGIRVILLP